MTFHARLLALSFLASLAVATPLSTSHLSRDLVVHEARNVLPIGFSLAGPAAPHTPLTLRIALTQSNPDAIVDALYSVSDPASDKYGQYLSKAEVSNTSL